MISHYQFRKMVEAIIRDVVPAPRIQGVLGSNLTAANHLTLGRDGDSFVVTGATQINLLDTTGWGIGSKVTLILNGGATVKHNQAVSGTFIPIWLNGNVDFATSNPATLSLLQLATFWIEIGRKA